MREIGNEIVIATSNAGKVKEFAPLFQEKGIAVKSLRDFDDLPEIIEDGETFAANALIKARTIALHLRLPVIADDSGLTVDRLGGEPGVYSARYAGAHATDEQNNRKLLDRLKQLPAVGQSEAGGPEILSPARFVCAICLVNADGEPVAEVEDYCEGAILPQGRGEYGFGYDPLFYLPAYGKTMAELSIEQKNKVSHRGHAIRRLWEALQ
ncbi:XTP/dITP diphosphatase [Paenibacillus xerothermodurans]|uniref:dITP/XTP pyrophosphatase n=1 Tax=Paenibacillus xerothermodurans TaxID=1977292 RepID=A0A2W1NWA1_PAEXE|nr:XTP/dITP diphosphatase [Paenibacillus xerothermodurans]PZE19942.1 XTP/dITP diphosphatase [Paenibacillus xerothermodurans]